MLASNIFTISTNARSVLFWMLKLFLSSSFAVLTRKHNSSQKRCPEGATAYMKESNESRTYILLLSEIGWGTALKKLRLVYISYRNVQARDHFISDPNDPVVPPLRMNIVNVNQMCE